MKGVKTHRNYNDYVENVVNKCSHAWVVNWSEELRNYNRAKLSGVKAVLPPGKHLRVIPSRCRSYSCPICGAKKTFDLLERLRGMDLTRYRFFTLTMKNAYTLSDTEKQLNKITACFNRLNIKLRKLKEFKGLEYLRIIEIGKDGMVHIHGVWNKYIPIKKLSSYWFQITGDSYKVDLRRIHNSRDVYNYIFKYMTKDVTQYNITPDPTLINLDLGNTARIFYEFNKRRFQASQNFFPKKKKTKSRWLPFYYEKVSEHEVESALKYAVREWNLKPEHVDLGLYDSSDLFLTEVFNSS